MICDELQFGVLRDVVSSCGSRQASLLRLSAPMDQTGVLIR